MGRSPCCNEAGLKKGAWTADEDQKLIAYIQEHGEGGWRTLPEKAGLQRCGKSCRLRWANYLRPDIKRGEFTAEEELKIVRLHASLGNRWSAIARHLPKRTDNEIKNYWNTYLKKRLADMGIDPVTHKRITPRPGPTSGSVRLLNKLATSTNLAPSTCLDAIKTNLDLHSVSTDGGSDGDNLSSVTPRPPPVSTSAATLLNKMASRSLNCITALKTILSRSTDDDERTPAATATTNSNVFKNINYYDYMSCSTSASSLSETASDASRSISISNIDQMVHHDQTDTHDDDHNLELLKYPFDLDLLQDWQAISDGIVSSMSIDFLGT